MINGQYNFQSIKNNGNINYNQNNNSISKENNKYYDINSIDKYYDINNNDKYYNINNIDNNYNINNIDNNYNINNIDNNYDINNNNDKYYDINNIDSNDENDNNKYLINIDQALSESSYPKYIQEFIRNFIINNYYKHKEAKVYFTVKDKEKLFVICYYLEILLKKNKYNINILVYLPQLYPNYAPEFYIFRKGHTGIGSYYKDIINRSDLKISIDKICEFVPERNNIEEIIEKLKSKFKENFPIYKDSKEKFGFELIEKSNFDKESAKEVFFKPKPLNDDDILNYIKDETKKQIRIKYSEFKNKFGEFLKNNQNLKIIDKNIKKNLINNKLIKKKEQMNQKLIKIIEIKNKLNGIENRLIKENNEIQEINNNKTCFDKCNEIINIKDKEDMKFVIMKKTIEDYLSYLRKGYEKNIISFKDMINKTRILSRELFNINYLRNKNKHNY